MMVLKKDGIVFLLNAILFAILFYFKVPFFPIWIGMLAVILLGSYFLYSKQYFSNENIFIVSKFRISNVSGLVLAFLFSLNLLLSWSVLDWITISYVLIFSVIQLMITDFIKLED